MLDEEEKRAKRGRVEEKLGLKEGHSWESGRGILCWRMGAFVVPRGWDREGRAPKSIANRVRKQFLTWKVNHTLQTRNAIDGSPAMVVLLLASSFSSSLPPFSCPFFFLFLLLLVVVVIILSSSFSHFIFFFASLFFPSPSLPYLASSFATPPLILFLLPWSSLLLF